MIPKHIYQTHEWNYEDLPENFAKTSETWQKINPDFEYTYHNREQRDSFVRDFDNDMWNLYENVDPCAQADIWRYVILYKNGGHYADMDSVCTTSLGEWHENVLRSYNDFAIPFGTGGDLSIKNVSPAPVEGTTFYKYMLKLEHYWANNSNFAAVPNSKVLEKTLNNILSEYHAMDYKNIIDNSTHRDEPVWRYEFTKHWGASPFLPLLIYSVKQQFLIDSDSIQSNYDVFIHDAVYKKEFKDYFVKAKIKYSDYSKNPN